MSSFQQYQQPRFFFHHEYRVHQLATARGRGSFWRRAQGAVPQSDRRQLGLTQHRPGGPLATSAGSGLPGVALEDARSLAPPLSPPQSHAHFYLVDNFICPWKGPEVDLQYQEGLVPFTCLLLACFFFFFVPQTFRLVVILSPPGLSPALRNFMDVATSIKPGYTSTFLNS